MSSHVDMTKLFERKDTLDKELKKVDAAIKALQEVCEHDWQPNGHDSHKDWFVCKHCRKDDWR